MKKDRHVEAAITEALGDGSIRTRSGPLERQIIACCFHRKPELQTICSNLTPDDFADPRHKEFFKYISKMYETGKLPDHNVCLTQAKRSNDEIDPEDFDEALREALAASTDCDTEQVCHEIHDLYVVRRLLALGARISSNVAEGKSSVELVGQAEEAIKSITGEVIRENTLLSIDEIVLASPNGIDDIVNPPMDGIPSPWPTLNEYIYGFRPGQFVGIGARPGCGKSAALVQIAVHAALLGKVVAFFSHEMSALDIWTRIFCNQVGVKSSDMIHRQLTNDEKARIQDYIVNAAPRTLVISDRSGRTPLSMRSALARLKAKFGVIDMVIGDYFQLMSDPTFYNDRLKELGSISRFLKLTSEDFETRMIFAAQLRRQSTNKPIDSEPELDDFRECGNFEQDLDLALLIHRPTLNKKPKEGIPPPPDKFIVAKQRRGKTGFIPMRYDGEYYRFKEIIQ